MEAKAFEEKSLSELELEENPTLIALYDQALADMGNDQITKDIVDRYYGDSIVSIYSQVEKQQYEYMAHNTSTTLFPGEIVRVYPGITNPKAKKIITCDFSGARIYPGSLYVSYRPMIKNIYNGNAYVLSRTIKVETGYEWNLPTTIAGIEALNDKIRTADYRDCEDGIDYSHLSQRTGGELVFKLLKRRKRYEIRNCK